MRRHGQLVWVALLLPLAVLIGACGDSTRLPEAPATGALLADHVRVQQTGSAAARIDPSSVKFQLDDSGTLVIHLSITSQAATSQTLMVHAALQDQQGTPVGDAVGGAVHVSPGSSVSFELNGPQPSGTIAAAIFEVLQQASPTPTSSTPQSVVGTPSS